MYTLGKDCEDAVVVTKKELVEFLDTGETTVAWGPQDSSECHMIHCDSVV